MSQHLSRLALGQRIATLRKQKGLTQEEIAQQVGISRTAIVQIELGNRGIDVEELQRISETLGASIYALLSIEADAPLDFPATVQAAQAGMRIAVPSLKLEKFMQVLLYILERCAGKPNVGETVLNKLLYFSDFNYYELYEEQMTGASYRKLPFGPVPQRMDVVLQHMVEHQILQRVKTEYHGYIQSRYLPLQKADLRLLKGSETEVIDRVIEQMGNWSASAISDWSHKDMPWLATMEGEEIDYELAFYREVPFSVRNYDEAEEGK
jgi:transcriptional regulator with XRE-family HTH domain